MNEEERKNRFLHTCKFYNNAIRNRECDAGVKYASLRKANRPLPCFPSLKLDLSRQIECRLFQPQTEEAYNERMASQKVALESITKVIPLLDQWKVSHQPGETGSIVCPICGNGTISISSSPGNGHIAAKCSTAKCVSIIE